MSEATDAAGTPVSFESCMSCSGGTSHAFACREVRRLIGSLPSACHSPAISEVDTLYRRSSRSVADSPWVVCAGSVR